MVLASRELFSVPLRTGGEESRRDRHMATSGHYSISFEEPKYNLKQPKGAARPTNRG